jgi:cell division transport system permease protein
MSDLGLDLPLEHTPASRFLVWISMALVFIAVLAFALAAMTDSSVREFARKPKVMTVALSPATSRKDESQQTAAVLAYLKGVEGVAFADPVSEQELGMIIEPWLADGEGVEGLPMPRLIDVGFNAGVEPDVAVIDEKLNELAPGSSIGYGGLQSDESAALARFVRLVSVIVGIVVIGIVTIVSGVVTRMSLDLHDETVDLLRLMGAGDNYVVRQFEQHALFNALRGAVIGFAAAIVTLLLLIWLGETWLRDLVTISLRPLDWVLLAMTPVLATILTAFVAKLTARWGLRRIH